MATVLLLCTSVAAADAANSAQATSGPTTVNSGSWAAIATTSTAAPYGTGPLALTFTLLGAGTKYFNVVNTGTLPLSGETFTATTTASSAVIEACSTTWSEPTGTCPSGIITTVTTTGASATRFASALPATGSSIRLRARLTSLKGDSIVTISVQVNRGEAGAAAISDS